MESSGVQHPINGSAKRLAAHSVLTTAGPRSRLGTQPLQSLKNLTAKLSWQNGTMSAMQPGGTSLTTPACTATSTSGGSATSAQWGSSTAGLQGLLIDLASTSQAVLCVLGKLLAYATHCKRCTLPSLQSGTMPRTKPSLEITLPTPLIRLGGLALNAAAGNSPSTRAQIKFKCLRGQSRFKRGVVLQIHSELTGLRCCAQPVVSLCLVLAAAMLPMRCPFATT